MAGVGIPGWVLQKLPHLRLEASPGAPGLCGDSGDRDHPGIPPAAGAVSPNPSFLGIVFHGILYHGSTRLPGSKVQHTQKEGL